jgi:hypothetical protein
MERVLMTPPWLLLPDGEELVLVVDEVELDTEFEMDVELELDLVGV